MAKPGGGSGGGGGGGKQQGSSSRFGADPVSRPDSVTTSESTSITINVLANDSDSDKGDILSVVSVDTTGTLGDVAINADGTITYSPGTEFADLFAGQTGTDVFTYEVRDLADNKRTETVTVNINGEGEQVANGFEGGSVLLEAIFESNVVGQQAVTVGDGVEHLGHTLLQSQPYIDVDIEASAIHFSWGHFESDFSSSPGYFVKLSDNDGSIPAIDNVTLSSNVSGLDSSDVSWDEDSILIDFGSIMVFNGDGSQVDLTVSFDSDALLV